MEDSGSNRSDEPVSSTIGVADNNTDGQIASDKDRDQQLWPLFRASSVFVFNTQKDDVKGVGGKIERKKVKSVGTNQRNNRKKRVEISNNSISNYFKTSSRGSTNTKPSLAATAEHSSLKD